MDWPLGLRRTLATLAPIGVTAIALAALSACADDESSNTGASETSTSGPTSDASTATDSSASADATSSTSSTSTTGPTTDSTTTSTTDSTTAGPTTNPTSVTTSESTTDTDGQAACMDFCTVELECGDNWPDLEACVDACIDNLVEAGGFSPDCEGAWQALYECVGGLSCEEWAEYANPQMVDYPCSDQVFELDFACEGQ